MFVTFTNANPLHKGNPVSIKRDLIVTIYASTQVREDNTVDQVTFVFVPPHGTWEVQETFDQVMEILNAD
jgi:hypothetical protein